MIDAVLADRAVRAAVAECLGDTATLDDAIARVVWHVLCEPGDAVAGALIAEYGPVDGLRVALFDAADAVASLTPDALREARKRWEPRLNPQAVRDAVHSARVIGARLVVPGAPVWPHTLNDLGYHAPLLLWARGDVATLAHRPAVSLVGARAATAYGEQIASEFAGDLAASGILIVSGGAYGIDGAAHRAALGVGGRTVAFLAGGVDRAYPAGHAGLFRSITDAGCVVSEVPCGSAPSKWRFLLRNRLIAALSDATVVIEAGWRSGSLNTAGHAAALGRPLGAVPGPVTSAASAGCHRLLREYDALCVTTSGEVRELCGVSEAALGGAITSDDPDETRLLDAASTRAGRSAAELARRSGLAIARVEALLGVWSLTGQAEQAADGTWRVRRGRERTD